MQDISRESRPRGGSTGSTTPPTADFGTQCLLARRLSERGVRFVQCNLGGWDAHNNLKANHAGLARAIDKPIAGLLTDLKQRGLWDETLVSGAANSAARRPVRGPTAATTIPTVTPCGWPAAA